jgi:hypothetical protein
MSTGTYVPKHSMRSLATRAPRITGEFLQGAPTGFGAFMRDPVYAAFVDRIVGIDNDVAMLVAELRRLGLDKKKRMWLRSWVLREWLPSTVDPVKRGQAYWARVASMVWEIYETVLDLRHRTKMAIKCEIRRIACADKRKHAKMLAARKRRKRRRCAR